MFTDQQIAKCVLCMNFMKLLLLQEENSEFFYNVVHYHQTPMQYCVGRKNSKKQRFTGFAINAILNFLLEFNDNAHDKKF
jgi:hypothetical protein